jgi:hypothetical protein
MYCLNCRNCRCWSQQRQVHLLPEAIGLHRSLHGPVIRQVPDHIRLILVETAATYADLPMRDAEFEAFRRVTEPSI